MGVFKLVQKKKKLNKIWHNYYDHLYFSYHSLFFGSLISRGHKLKAFNNFLLVKKNLKIVESLNPSIIFLVAMMSASPNIQMKPIKLGAFTHGVPYPISLKKKITFGVKWAVKLLKDTKSNFTPQNSAEILISTIYGEGFITDKKHLLYKSGYLNRHLLMRFFK